MKLTELLNGINAVQVIGNIRNAEVSSIEFDSRKVLKNSLFVAIKGFTVDGHRFIQDAIENGAIAVVLENDNSVSDDIFKHGNAAKILVADSRKSLAEISNFYFNHPSSKLKLVGITGTNGKTTSSYFIKNIFETAGYKTGLLGTISNYIGKKAIDSKLTTPESNNLNEMLTQMVSEKCSHAVMEVSSHSLALNRVTGLRFNSAVFTNITSDHLDFHESFENYFNAKKLLFDSLDAEAFVVYNSDDKYSTQIIADCNARKYSFGTLSNADFSVNEIDYNLSGTTFTICHNKNDYLISTSLVGDFNAYNACAAFAVGKIYGIKEDHLIMGIKTTPQIPGRFEVISAGSKNVIVDYSHTPDSLKKTLQVIRKLNKENKEIITVFGCGGNRDKIKRPEMGKIATGISDKVIITSDNPRDENPFEIINDITNGIESNNFNVIESRAEAIRASIKQSSENAIILIAGKGHEEYQEIKGKRVKFSDKKIALQNLNN
ncbi:UDP-N-acetylmuramoyl-L-alanyl-D-glutamate--2,6-diaminopimelate ligase [Bacteroidota bacterium]